MKGVVVVTDMEDVVVTSGVVAIKFDVVVNFVAMYFGRIGLGETFGGIFVKDVLVFLATE